MVSFLSAKGYKIDGNPNTFLTDDQINALKKKINSAVVPAEKKEFGTILLDAPKINIKSSLVMKSPIQKILFGSPGTGKSHRVEVFYCSELGIDVYSENCIKTVFHPEYSYGDFMGKLLPRTIAGDVRYDYYEGDFLST